ncbi:MAG: response regulator [Lachnospiraceae bacterium]|nr:response regulator [Lachnospiraceae bacterium]
MKSVLIVEDEKMIRRGICTMVERSGVPVEMIMECQNGELAWEILKDKEVDVMFTDIRMPKMDGIELVRLANTLPKPPLMVAISGYDDFSYAVEMLRSGVREYILKPVERDKIAGILKTLNEEIEGKNLRNMKDKDFGLKEVRQLVERPVIDEARIQEIAERYSEIFVTEPYRVVIAPVGSFKDVIDGILFENINASDVLVLEEPREFDEDRFEELRAGASDVHTGLVELRKAYKEALERRKRAFVECRGIKSDDDIKEAPEPLRVQAKRLVEEAALMQRLQLVGTKREDELDEQWGKLFTECKRGNLSYDDFEAALTDFNDNVKKIYKNSVTEEAEEELKRLRDVLSLADIDEYREALMEWIMKLRGLILQSDDSEGKKKLKAAVEYVEQNYMKDLNMAVVSNYISMNYSMLSYLFKQYTGTNFVNYLKGIRIKEAKKLLSDTDMKIIEVSRAVGYDNEKHFMKTFKAECGVSPGEYRKNMQRQ